jgi:hypothetical protein
MIPGPRHDEHLRKEHAGTVGAGPRSVGPGACPTSEEQSISTDTPPDSYTIRRQPAVQHNGRSEGSAVTH